MKTKKFRLTSDQLIVTDPGYDFEAAKMYGLGAIVSPCRSGLWSVNLTMHRPPHRGWDLPHVLVAVHTDSGNPATSKWHRHAKELGGDHGMIGIYDAAHFHDASLVTSDTRWTFDGGPADPNDLWYSWVCEHAKDTDWATFPYGLVVNWDLGSSLDLTFDASGVVTALRLTFHDIEPKPFRGDLPPMPSMH
jgi:hypothetical protein